MTANAKIHQYQVLTFRYRYEQSVTRVSKEVTAQRKVYIGSEPNDFDINRNRYSENFLVLSKCTITHYILKIFI